MADEGTGPQAPTPGPLDRESVKLLVNIYRDTTPARAEAQDEGAAGKWPEVTDQWAETYCDLTGQNPDGVQVSFIGDGAVTTTFRDKAKRQIEAMLCAAPKAAVRAISAHPSPTPAADADADRVRIAVEALERYAEQGYVGAQAALDKIGAPK